MVKLVCDRCRADCDLVGFDVRVNVLHNPTPHSVFETGEPKITDCNTHARFLLCQKCYKEMNLPNVYMAKEAKQIVWREDDFLSTVKEQER